MTADELAAGGFVVPKLPKVVRIEPASACNLHCIHCPTGVNKPVPGERGVMSRETFDLILTMLRADVPDVVVLYHGGEPLLNKMFVDMIRQIKWLGVRFVKTVSNGLLLTEPVMRGIIEAELDAIEFSLDGTSPAENNAIRVGCDFDAVVAKVKRLVDLREELGAALPQVFIANTQMLNGAHDPGGPPAPPQFLLDAFSGRYASRVSFKTQHMIFWPGLNAKNYERVETPVASPSHVKYCDHIVNTISIRWNGDIVPCCYDITSKFVIGNIRDGSLADLWNNTRYRQLRQDIYDGTYPALCVNCPVVKPNLYMKLRRSGGSSKLETIP